MCLCDAVRVREDVDPIPAGIEHQNAGVTLPRGARAWLPSTVAE